MRIAKNAADILSNAVDQASKHIPDIVDGLTESKKQKEVQAHATEIAGNYGKALAQIASNTTPAEKAATEAASELSELEKLFAKLETKGKKVIQIQDGKDELEVILFHGKHNDYFKSRDGKIFRVRYSKDDELNKTLIAVANAYKERGVKTPDMMTVNIGGKRGVASQLITDLQPKENNPKAVYDLFATDVLFGNRNAYRKGVTMLNADGEPVRLTTSGCAGYRVRGEKRPDFTEELTELRTFLDPRVNPESAEFLKDMTCEDLLNSIKRATKASVSWDIPTHSVLDKRRKNLKEFWMRAKLMPQEEGESLLDYVTRVQNRVKEVHHENAYYTQRLNEIVDGYHVDGQYSWDGFTNTDKETIKKFIDLASKCNDVPKALFERGFSRDEMLKLAKMQFQENKGSTSLPWISVSDEPEIFSRVLYSPYKSRQTSIDELARFSGGYSGMRMSHSSGEPGPRTILDKGLLDKFYKGEMSFGDFKFLGGIYDDKWKVLESRKLLEPIAGMDKPVRRQLLYTLVNMSDENYAKMLTRPEVLKDMPYRSKPLDGDILYEVLDLTDEEYKQLLKWHIFEDKYPGEAKRLFEKLDIQDLARMTDEEMQTAISRGLLKHRKEFEPGKELDSWNCQLYGSEIRQLAQMSDTEFNNLVERGLFSGKYDFSTREKLYETADFSRHDLDILGIYGIKSDFKYDDFEPEQLRRILALPNKGRINELKRLNPVDPSGKQSFGRADKLLDNEGIIKFAELPDKAYERALSIIKNEKLLNGPFKHGGIYEAALCDDKTWQTIQRRGLLDVDNPPFANMEHLLGKVYIPDDIQKEFPHATSMTLLAKIPDEKWEQFKRLGLLSTDPKKGQLSGRTLYVLSRYSDDKFDKLMRTKIFEQDYTPAEHHGYDFDYYFPTWDMEGILDNLTTKEIDKLAKRDFFTLTAKEGFHPRFSHQDVNTIKKAAYWSDEQFENYKNLLEVANDQSWLALEAASRFTSKTEVQRILDRNLMEYSKGFDGENSGLERLKNLSQLVKLTDNEWKFVKPLVYEYGFGMGRYFHIAKAINPGKGAAHLVEFVNGRKNIYEFSFRERRQLLNHIIHTGGEECSGELCRLIPEGTIIPRTYYRRKLLIEDLTQSIGMTSKKLTDAQISSFKTALSNIAKKDSGIMSTDFNAMSTKLPHRAPSPRLLYSREKFVNDVIAQIKDLPEIEQKKIFDYFSFDIEKDPSGKLKLVGYPDPVGKASKFDEYEDAKTKQIIQKLRPYVDKFSNGNKIFVDGNPKLEAEMNKILDVFPEFATTIGKVQHETQDFTVDVHIMKVLQGVMADPRYAKLSDKDKVVMQISTILHDLTKAEGVVDKSHPADSAFDAYYIVNRLNLPREDKLKIYEVIKNHDWLEKLNKKVKVSDTEYRDLTPEEYRDRLQKIAFSHRQNDCFEMSSILTKADLKGVKANDEFFIKFKGAYEQKSADVQKLIDKIKETAIHIPQTKIPKASELVVDNDIVKQVTRDGITNTVIYLKPGQDLSKVGFAKGVTSDEFNTIVHALDVEEQASVFRALGIVDSDALLSSSWVNYGKGNYKVFRGQGFVLKVDSDDIHAGTAVDFGSGYKKDYDTLLNEYLFGTERSDIRKFWSNQVKAKFGLDTEGYKKFNDSIKNKSFDQIKAENPETAKKIQEIVDDMDVKRRAGGRNYNEWLISRPEIQGGFFWGKNSAGQEKQVGDVPLFIREYLAENNLPLIFFGV